MSSQQEQPKLEVKFLDDSPVSDDELELHKNIAENIKKIIELIQNSNKKIIGLFGSWGSGKSTVVKILEKDLGEDKIFIFDSWSHRGDFLKRAFLLELAKKFNVLDKKYKITKQNNNEITIKDVLLRKIINKELTIHQSDFWLPVKIFSFIIILSVIIFSGYTLFDKLFIPFLNFLFDNLTLKFIGIIDNNVIKSFLIIILIVSFIAIWKILQPLINFYFFKRVSINESHTTKEDLEFTNYDYGEYLCYILEKAKLNKDDPFVIIFDNLDRVDNETVLNTLSLIQLTIEIIEKGKENERCNFSNIYFLIPIDKERLEKTIRTIIPDKNNNDQNDENGSKKFTKDFLEKIFPYKVEIPDINHSDWRKFFTEKLQEAFGKYIDEEEILVIRRLFEKSIASSNLTLTPRVIKIFINNLVENYIYWNDEISINSQTLYVLLNNYLSDGFKDYIKNIGNKQQKKGRSITDVETLIRYFENECPNEKVIDNLLKQFYKVHEIYILFIESFIKAIETKSIDEINKIINILKKNKIEILIDEVWERKAEDFNRDINLLLGFFYSLKSSNFKTKFKNLYNNIYKTKILPTIKNLIKDTDKLVNLDTANLEELKDILEENDDLKKLFIEKSVEIMTTIPKEKNNEK